MRASINGGAPQELDDAVADCLVLDAAPAASGQIRDVGAVRRAHLWRSLREGSFYWRVGVVGFLIFIGLFGVPAPKLWEIGLLLAAAVAVAIEAAIRIERGAEWRSGVARHLAALPPPGTLVAVAEESGLTIGATHTPWDALRFEDAALRKFSVATNYQRTRYRVDRMRLATNGGSVVLDPIAIERGQAIVDAIWRRLQR